MSSVRLVTYQCAKCGAIDGPVRYHPGFPPPLPCINCWKCHNGQGHPYQEMLATSQGMFPVKDETVTE